MTLVNNPTDLSGSEQHAVASAEPLPRYPVCRTRLPDENLSSGGYTLRFATSDAELEPIYRLRYDVFNVELGEGLDESHLLKMDTDSFDPHHHHLYVSHNETGICAGTYRMQTVEMARAGLGFYSGTEFDLQNIPGEVLDNSIEIGRACIHEDHRTLRVLHLLWRGLGLYLAHNQKRYLFGCCSLTSQNEAEGLAVFYYLINHQHVTLDWQVQPREENRCRTHENVPLNSDSIKIPRLMRAYLAQGAKICGPPAIDRAFKTIDYLALFDTASMTKSALAFYRIGG